MLQLVFSVFELCTRFSLVCLSLFNLLLHFRQLRVELPNNIFFLFFFQFIHTIFNLVDLRVYLLLELLEYSSILLISFFFIAESDSQLSLKFLNPSAVVLLALVVAFLSPLEVFLNLFILIDLGIKKYGDLTEELVPLDRLDVLRINTQY
jgi:hypothetical protein